jgi:hypothetical protein
MRLLLWPMLQPYVPFVFSIEKDEEAVGVFVREKRVTEELLRFALAVEITVVVVEAGDHPITGARPQNRM